jgi:hypothetical protein
MTVRPRFFIAHRPDPTRRTSPDSAWPLRGADGLTWAERKAQLDKETPDD